MAEHPRRQAAHVRTGEEGERIAERFLRGIGYDIRGRNIRVGRDEIDILAFDPGDGVLVFAEVKARRKKGGCFPPEMNVGWRKTRRLLRAMGAWVAAHQFHGACRADILCVEGGEVTRHYRQAGAEY